MAKEESITLFRDEAGELHTTASSADYEDARRALRRALMVTVRADELDEVLNAISTFPGEVRVFLREAIAFRAVGGKKVDL